MPKVARVLIRKEMEGMLSTVIMKTDLAGFTDRVSKSSHGDLSELLKKHDSIIKSVIDKNEGKIIKGEGDSFWITFKSVTSAALSAIEIQRDLQYAQVGMADYEKMAIRIAITVGDILHQDNDIFGDSVNLTARIESITPPGETYISAAASLVVDQKQVDIEFVKKFELKGFANAEPIYRLNPSDEIRIFENQVFLGSFLNNFSKFTKDREEEEIEELIIKNDSLVKKLSEDYGGKILQEAYCNKILIFNDPLEAIEGVREWVLNWNQFLKNVDWDNWLNIGIHHGNINSYRSHVFGQDLAMALALGFLSRTQGNKIKKSRVLVTSRIYSEIQNGVSSESIQELNPFELVENDKNRKEEIIYLQSSGFKEGDKVYDLLFD